MFIEPRPPNSLVAILQDLTPMPALQDLTPMPALQDLTPMPAMAESFFASLEHELLARRSFKSKAEAKTALFTYIEAWYNFRRRHSGIAYMSPTTFEAKNAKFFEQRVIHSPAPVSLKGQHERGAMDNPAPIDTEVSDNIIDTSLPLEFLQP